MVMREHRVLRSSADVANFEYAIEMGNNIKIAYDELSEVAFQLMGDEKW